VDFDEFAATRVHGLLRFARALVGDRGTAEDVVQDVVLRLYQRREALAEVNDLDAYARRMVINAYLSWGRKWFRVIPVGTLADIPSTGDPADRVADHDDLHRRLAQLPKRQRTVIVLRYLNGLSDTQIASELGCNVTTVRSHASRALSALRIESVGAPQTSKEQHR
jgi:RNA polymerase sigma-70 factor (sigma-E family)